MGTGKQVGLSAKAERQNCCLGEWGRTPFNPTDREAERFFKRSEAGIGGI